MPPARQTFYVLAVLTFLLVTVQFFLAGVGIFGAGSFDAHEAVGGALHVTTLLMLLAALFGKLGRSAQVFGGVLLVLIVVQTGLPSAPDVIAALHPLLAVAIWFGSYQAVMWARAAAPAPAASPPLT